jgi:trimeric autotransporter adhesin
VIRFSRRCLTLAACVAWACGGGDSSGPPALASIVVTPASRTVAPGGTVQLTAAAKDASGNSLTGRTIAWTSSDGQIAAVNAAGLVTGVSEGTATITASAEGVSGSASITVQSPVASVTVTPSTSVVAVGTVLQLTAATRDAIGNSLPGRTVSWSTSNTAVATVTSSGVVQGVADGSRPSPRAQRDKTERRA